MKYQPSMPNKRRFKNLKGVRAECSEETCQDHERTDNDIKEMRKYYKTVEVSTIPNLWTTIFHSHKFTDIKHRQPLTFLLK